jgi:hypothetical protein
MATLITDDDCDDGWRLDHWREGVTTARIVWRDGQGTEHDRVLTDEATALLALEWVGSRPRMTLVSFEMRDPGARVDEGAAA